MTVYTTAYKSEFVHSFLFRFQYLPAHFILVHCSMFSFISHATKCDRHYMKIHVNK